MQECFCKFMDRFVVFEFVKRRYVMGVYALLEALEGRLDCLQMELQCSYTDSILFDEIFTAKEQYIEFCACYLSWWETGPPF